MNNKQILDHQRNTKIAQVASAMVALISTVEALGVECSRIVIEDDRGGTGTHDFRIVNVNNDKTAYQVRVAQGTWEGESVCVNYVSQENPCPGCGAEYIDDEAMYCHACGNERT